MSPPDPRRIGGAGELTEGSMVVGGIGADARAEPTLDLLISFALAEANWAERALHPTMSSALRRYHEHHARMHLTIARRLEELKESMSAPPRPARVKRSRRRA